MVKREYFKQGKIEQFRQILEEGSSSGKQLYDDAASICSRIGYFENISPFCFFLARHWRVLCRC